jgi:hypothetical protein
MNKLYILFYLVLSLFNNFLFIQAIDFEKYIEINHIDPLDTIKTHQDIISGQWLQENTIKKTSDLKIPKNNFDWRYYVKKNKLNVSTKKEALIHYKTIGIKQKLKYCKSYNIAILLHLYNLNLMDEFIEKLNNFMENNHENRYHIKITIPIGNNIDQYNGYFIDTINNKEDFNELQKIILENTPYHKDLVSHDNIYKLYYIYQHLYSKLNIDINNLQIIFMENRGVDIGGFLIALDQLFKQNIQHDFIIKIHSKAHTNHWRQILLSFFNIPINNLLKRYEAFYSFKVKYELYNPFYIQILNNISIPYKNSYYHSSGNMFIVSNKFTQYLEQYNLIEFFHDLPTDKQDYTKCVGWEAAFGALIDYLNLKVGIIDYIPYLIKQRL